VLILLAATVSAWPGAVERLPAMDMPLYAAVVIGGIWLCLWQERWRWLGAIPVAAAALLMAGHEPPDLIIHGEGRDLGFMTQRGELVTLRAGARSLVGRSWSDATAADAVLSWEGSGYGRCSRDACTATIQRGGRAWTLLATRSRYPIARPVLAPSCEAADIVVSDRRLPGWCRPRWLKLDRARLEQTGAVAIRFDPLRIETAAEPRAGHPWATGR
jgi:competence protein ComEC